MTDRIGHALEIMNDDGFCKFRAVSLDPKPVYSPLAAWIRFGSRYDRSPSTRVGTLR